MGMYIRVRWVCLYIWATGFREFGHNGESHRKNMNSDMNTASL